MHLYFFINDTATTEIYTYCHTLSLPDALPISRAYTRRDRLPERQSMSARFRVASLFLAIALVAPMMAIAPDEYVVDLSRIDPSAILARAGDVLLRAPDAPIDDPFQATHAAAPRSDERRVGKARVSKCQFGWSP